MSPRFAKTLALGLGLTFAFGIVVGLEILSAAYLKSLEMEPKSLLWESASELPPVEAWDAAIGSLTRLDPHLGYSNTRGWSKTSLVIPGFRFHPSPGVISENPLRIVTLGGSTTAPSKFDWPSTLHRLLISEGYEVEVLNGGVAGYSSSQDLLKFLRDVVNLKPDIVIAVEGVNDLGFIHAIPKHPMVHPYQYKLMQHLWQAPVKVLPNTQLAIRQVLRAGQWRVSGISLGPPTKMEPVESWFKNVRTMSIIATEFGIHYLNILQPILGFGQLKPSTDESKMLRDIEKREYYLKSLRSFYPAAKKMAAQRGEILDLTDLFSGHSNVYRDPRHQTETGVEILAAAILEEMMSRGWMRPTVDTPSKH